MNQPRIEVDFNEMLESNLVLLSAEDTKRDANGEVLSLYEGLNLVVYMNDVGNDGKPDNLIARGIVERNYTSGWAKHVKWCCRIDADGIRHESEL